MLLVNFSYLYYKFSPFGFLLNAKFSELVIKMCRLAVDLLCGSPLPLYEPPQDLAQIPGPLSEGLHSYSPREKIGKNELLIPPAAF